MKVIPLLGVADGFPHRVSQSLVAVALRMSRLVDSEGVEPSRVSHAYFYFSAAGVFSSTETHVLPLRDTALPLMSSPTNLCPPQWCNPPSGFKFKAPIKVAYATFRHESKEVLPREPAFYHEVVGGVYKPSTRYRIIASACSWLNRLVPVGSCFAS